MDMIFRGWSMSLFQPHDSRLEARVSVRLLTRTARKLAPTEAGERMLRALGPALDTIAGRRLIANVRSWRSLRVFTFDPLTAECCDPSVSHDQARNHPKRPPAISGAAESPKRSASELAPLSPFRAAWNCLARKPTSHRISRIENIRDIEAHTLPEDVRRIDEVQAKVGR